MLQADVCVRFNLAIQEFLEEKSWMVNVSEDQPLWAIW